jgi:hypothetical protein
MHNAKIARVFAPVLLCHNLYRGHLHAGADVLLDYYVEAVGCSLANGFRNRYAKLVNCFTIANPLSIAYTVLASWTTTSQRAALTLVEIDAQCHTRCGYG